MFLDTSITADDMASIAWQKVIANCSKRECSLYEREFIIEFKKATEVNELKSEAVWGLLAFVCAFVLKLDERKNPFVITQFLWNFPAPTIDSLKQVHLQTLQDFYPRVDDAELRARIKDLLWIKRAVSYTIALSAVDDYLASATVLEDAISWFPFVDRIERALQIAISLKNTPYIDKIADYIEIMVNKHSNINSSFMVYRLMKMMLTLSRFSGEQFILKYGNVAKQIAVANETANQWYFAREYWQIEAAWHDLGNNTLAQKEALINAAATYNNEAFLNPSAATDLLARGIEAYRRIDSNKAFPIDPNIKSRIQELRLARLKYQERFVETMQTFDTHIDLEHPAQIAKNRVRSKTFQEALLILANLNELPSITQLKSEAQLLIEKSPFIHLFHRQLVDESGRVIAETPGTLPGKDDNIVLKTEMISWARNSHDIFAYGIVIPIIHEINLEHNFRIQDLTPVVTDRPFVPPGREQIFAQGLYYGLVGDFPSAVHLLIPQIENSLRYILRLNGVIASSTKDSSVEEDYDLNKILYMPELTSIIGETFVFHLQTLLVERFGSNFRNRLAHGLLSHEELLSPPAVFSWWSVLHLCYRLNILN